MGRGSAVIVGLALAMATRLAAQAPATADAPVFTVVSVKPNTSGSYRSSLDLQPGGRFTAVNVALLGLVRVAYGDDGPLTQDQLAVSEAWAERRAAMSEKYDIQANAERELAQRDLPRALRQLLSDRFKLVVHRETRAVPSYGLVLVRADGRFGPSLRRSSIDCTQPPASGAEAGGRSVCGFRSFPGKAGGRVLIGDLARRVLPGGVSDGRPIEDRTGLQGTFDFALEWTPDAAAPVRPPDAPPPIDPNGSSFVTALREQLGLKLEARTGSIDVLVVDRAERPSPD